MNWYVVYTQAQKEALANHVLRKQGFQTYFLHHATVASRTVSPLCVRAFMPRYLFVRAETARLHEVNRSMFVHEVLHPEGSPPLPVPDDAMAELVKEYGEKGEVGRTRERKLLIRKRGETIRFAEKSPFWGFYALITQVLDNDRLRVKLLHQMFGSDGREIEVNASDVGEIAEAKKARTA